MKKKRLIRIMAMLVCSVFLTGLFPTKQVEAATPNSASEIQQRINELESRFSGKYFTVNQQDCAKGTKGHGCSNCATSNIVNATWFKNIFGNVKAAQFYSPGQSCWGFAWFAEWYIFRNSNSDTIKAKTIATGVSFDKANVAKYCQIGDYLRLGDSHSVVIISYDDNGIKVIDSNWNYNVKVTVHTVKYSNYSKMNVQRAYSSTQSGPVSVGFPGTTLDDTIYISPEKTTYTHNKDVNNGILNVRGSITSGLPITRVRATLDGEQYCNYAPNSTYVDMYDYKQGVNSFKAEKLGLGPHTIIITAENAKGSKTQHIYIDTVNNTNYTISFNANGGSPNSSVTKSGGSTLGTLPTPSRTGHSFDGWYTAASGGSKISTDTTVTGNVTYYAHWTANTYTVSFNDNGSVETVTKAAGSTIGSLPLIIRNGYSFDGWYTAASGGTKISSSTVVTGNVTYYAHWTANTYTVSYNANGGSPNSSVSRTYGSILGTLPTPRRSGYFFDGWYTAASGGSKISAGTTVTGNVTYYAAWNRQNPGTLALDYVMAGSGKEIKVPIRLDQNPGIMIVTMTIGYDKTKLSFEGVEDGKFKEWIVNKEKGTISWFGPSDKYSNGTIVTLVFKTTNNFNGIADITLEKVEAANQREESVVFSKSDGKVIFNESLLYYIGYHPNKGTGAPESQSFTNLELVREVTISIAEDLLARSSLDACIASGDESSIQGALANWELRRQAVLEATKNLELVYETGKNLSQTKPTRSGYIFQGWATNVKLVTINGEKEYSGEVVYQPGDTYKEAEDAVLFAIWSPITYAIKYNANGGSGAPAAQTKTYGTALTLSNTKPTRSGYTFQGWSTTKDGNAAYQPGGSYTANEAVTLYAVWKINTYKVKFDANGGSGAPAAQTKTYGKALTLSSTSPTLTGHTFQGWATSKDGSAAYQPGGNYTANKAVTLYAVWEKNAENTMTLEIGKASGVKGGKIVLPIKLGKNVGVSSMRLMAEFDSSKLKLTGVKDGDMKGWTFNSDKNILIWYNEKDYTSNGTVVSLEFEIIKNFTGDTSIGLKEATAADDTKEYNLTVNKGTISYSSRLPGDVNDDKKVSLVDLVRLCKYLAGYDVEIHALNSDVTADGKVSLVDLVRLCKYLAGYNVVLE